MPRIAFHAPMKPPDHPTPSGDREMARLLIRALEETGFPVDVASRLRSYSPDGDNDASQEAEAEIARLLALYRSRPEQRPDIWFTYHVYYKAPDLLGPTLSKTLGIPYVIAEGSRAPKRAIGRWAKNNALADAALAAASVILIPNPRDRAMLEAVRPPRQRLVDLPPFIDGGQWPLLPRETGRGPFRLLAVAMMREGDKMASYRLLADALGLPAPRSWHLDIVGDGPCRTEVERLFAPFGDRVCLHGRADEREQRARFYAQADLLVWPAVNEAFGMVFLEAALQGCPSLAGDFGGVATVVRDGHTGLLAKAGDAAAFAAGLSRLMDDVDLRKSLSVNALHFGRQERSIEGTARLLREALAL